MATRDDLESYLIRLGPSYEEIEDGMWIVHAAEDGGAQVVVHHSPPVVLLRLKVMDLPADVDDARLAQLYRRLLELNAEDVLHGSYGVEEGDVILSDALELASLDFHELQSSYESMVFAASSHLPGLASLVPVAHEG